MGKQKKKPIQKYMNLLTISGVPNSPPIARVDVNLDGDKFNVRFPSREDPELAELCIDDDLALLLTPMECDGIAQALIVMAAEMERRGVDGRLLK